MRRKKECHLQLSVWINENLLEYKASSSSSCENLELENWKECMKLANGLCAACYAFVCIILCFFLQNERTTESFVVPAQLYHATYMTNNAQSTKINPKNVAQKIPENKNFKRFLVSRKLEELWYRLFWTIRCHKRLNLFQVFLRFSLWAI